MHKDEVNQGHGMGLELEQKDWINITQQDLEGLAADYAELQAALEIVWHSPRPFSSAAIVKTASAEYLIKRSHQSFRSVDDLQQEHQFIQHLADKGIAVSVLLPNHAGQTATARGEWVYEVHHKIQAHDLYAEHHSWKSFFYPQHAHAAGQFLARLHAAALDFDLPARRTQYLLSNQRLLDQDDLLLAIQQRIRGSVGLSAYFQDQPLTEAFQQQIRHFHLPLKAVLPKLTSVWTHNDLHGSNLFWRDASPQADVAAVIDFGLSDRTTMAYDIAVAIERNFVDWMQLHQPDQAAQHDQANQHAHETQSGQANISIDYPGLASFIQGYIAAGGDVQQLAEVVKILPLAHIDFALYELEYFVEISKNSNHADAAYRYLIEHTAWFYGDQGQQLLSRLGAVIQQYSADL